MAHDFPNSPSVGDTTTANGITYRWDGSSWNIVTESVRNVVDTMSGSAIDYNAGSYHVLDLDSTSSSATLSVSNLPTTPEKHTLQVNFTEELSFSLSNTTYDNVSFSVASQDTLPTDLFFKPDGTKMYVLGDSNDRVYQYTLSTAWDLSTASYDSVSYLINISTTSLFFDASGTRMFIIDFSYNRVIYYPLSVAWDISSASYTGSTFSITQDSNPYGVTFKSDGTKMYIIGYGSDNVYQYTLSTAWNLSTVSYDSVSFSVASQDATPHGIFFNSEGTKMFIAGNTNDSVYQYTLSTAWDLSTASYDSVSFSVASQDTNPSGIFFKSDDTKMYMVGSANDTVYQYSITVSYDVTWPGEFEFNENTPPTSPTTQSSLILELYNPDNTKIYATQKFNNS